MDEYIDVIIPRGGKGLIEKVMSCSTIPMIKHLDGNCHVYIDKSADKINAYNDAKKIEIFPDAIGLFFVLETFLSNFLSKISLIIQPADLIKIAPRKKRIK